MGIITPPSGVISGLIGLGKAAEGPVKSNLESTCVLWQGDEPCVVQNIKCHMAPKRFEVMLCNASEERHLGEAITSTGTVAGI